MTKKVLFASLIALSGIFATASAQKPQGHQCAAAEGQACAASQSCSQSQGKCAFNPFEGLNLTEQQQAKLDALKQEKKAAKDAAKKDKADRKQADRAQAKSQRAEELAKIKEILTPEQYVTFLENNYLNAGNRQMMAHGDRKLDRQHMQGKKCDKAGCDNKGPKGDKKGQKGDKDKK